MLDERIYGFSPIFVQNILVSLKGWQIHRVRYLSAAHYRMKEILLANEGRALHELKHLQFQELRSFIEDCYRLSPYYRCKFDALGLHPDDIKRSEDFSLVPVTPKQDLRAHTHEFFTQEIRRGMIDVHTSGTTGSPLTVYFSPEDIGRRYAFLERCRRWAGVHIGQRRASFTGRSIIPERQIRPPFWRYNRPGNHLLFSSYHLSTENLPAYVRALADFQPEIIDGYPSAIHVVAEHILRTDNVGLIVPRAILVSAETVLPHQRKAIETAFQTRFFNQYASSEGAPFISECKEGKLHVHLDSGVIEILKPDGAPAQPGELGEMVVTSFTTHVTPLLRYAIGDLAIPADEQTRCKCGLPFPVVEVLVGRVDDILYTPDRGYVGRLDTVFKKLPNSIVEAQIIQTSPKEVVLRLVPDRERYKKEHAELVVEEMRKRLGYVVTIQVQEVEQIPRSANGKMHPVINMCSDMLPKALRYSDSLSELPPPVVSHGLE
jgi:phenylacetate-CoA ligase